MKAAIYTRVSTNDQVMRGESLDMQKERLVAYVKSQGWELYKIYEDGGFSGKDTNRPGFQQMLSDVELRKFDVIVVYKIDRLSRSILDFHKTMEFFNKNKVSFVSITQQFDTTTSMGRLMLAILVDFANFEREIDVDRSVDSYMQRLSNGVPSGRIPFGYKRNGKEVVIVPDEAEVVKQIFSLALQNLSMGEVARRMGIDKSRVRRILRNPFYAGYIARRLENKTRRIPEEEWKWHKGKHEPIISLEIYHRVSELRGNKRKKIKSKHNSLFSKLIYCPYCEHNLSFHAKEKNGSTTFYYECDPIRLRGKACFQYIREDFLEKQFYEKLDSIFTIKKKGRKENRDIQKKTALIDKKIQRLVKLAQSDNVVLDEIEKQLKQLQEQRAKLLASQITKVDYKMVAKKLKSIKPLYSFMSREEKSRLWHMLVKRITAEKDKLTVEWEGNIESFVIPRDILSGKRGRKPKDSIEVLSPESSITPPFRTKPAPELAVCPVELRFIIKFDIGFIESIFKK